MAAPRVLHRLWTLALGLLTGAGLPLLLLWLAKAGDHVDLVSAEPEPGTDREVTIGATLVLWTCALAPPLAVALTAAWPKADRRMRLVAAVLAAVAVFATRPWIVSLAGARFRADAADAVAPGVLLGLAAGLLVAWRPVIGYALAVHAGVLWVPALLRPGAHIFAGWTIPVAGDLAIVVLPVLAGLAAGTAYLVTRRGAPALLGLAAAIAGPALAVLSYIISPHTHRSWDETAATAVGWAAAFALFASIFVLRVMAGVREQRRRDAERVS